MIISTYHQEGAEMSSTAHDVAILNVQDPLIDVTLLVGTPGKWAISSNLTDRWGNINMFDFEKKPLEQLENTPGLLNSLIEQLTDEITFVVRKDGHYGLLFEVEYSSIESEANNGDLDPTGEDAEYVAGLKPHSEVVARILQALQEEAHRFPQVEMCIPDASQICNDRPAAWAFMPSSSMTVEQREELALLLNSL
jgi:hypothetical protein